jgi:hypothetical protein
MRRSRVVAGAACLALGFFSLPYVPGNAAASSVAKTTPIGGPDAASTGSIYTLSGRTGTKGGARLTGPVVLRGRWNHGAWLTLAQTSTDARGAYKIAIRLERRGRLDLRLLVPGGVATKTLRVT